MTFGGPRWEFADAALYCLGSRLGRVVVSMSRFGVHGSTPVRGCITDKGEPIHVV
ncbi:hypothetical protein ACTWP6_20160 [Mycobacterium sp. 4D054]|uniref:hypothetical protein n=1 Tax=unclassified Mycobacterium TaxID=2642494 RepID=UPI0021B1F10F|nr:hypothetical protein [Mycobacterium sp. SMC-8]UXA09851.1 hypothetical protein KXD97_16760 [Mycobacterium sp. SMC-8]